MLPSLVVPVASVAVVAVADREVPGQRVGVRATGSLVGLFTTDDYPPDAWVAHETGTVKVQMTVTPEGRVGICTVEMSSMSPSLDASTCRILMERARFEPARDRAGRSVSDTFSQRVSWKIPSADPRLVADEDWVEIVDVPVRGSPVCTFHGDGVTVPIAGEKCLEWQQEAALVGRRFGNEIRAPYRAKLAFNFLVGTGLPAVINRALTVRSGVLLRIAESGAVSGCKPLEVANLNGDDGTDLCVNADKLRFKPISPSATSGGDREMLMLHTVTFEPGVTPPASASVH